MPYRGYDLPVRFKDLSPCSSKSVVGIIVCMLLKSRRQGLIQDTFWPFVRLNNEELRIVQDFSRLKHDDKLSVYQQFQQHFGNNQNPSNQNLSFLSGLPPDWSVIPSQETMASSQLG